jgi:hypothetical protein
MNALCYFLTPMLFTRTSSFLLTLLFLGVTLTFADEPAKAAIPTQNTEQAARIKQLQQLSLEDLHKVPVISNKSKQNQSVTQTIQPTNCYPRDKNENCK